MADSRRERIIKDLQTALEGVTVDNGYANTLNAVQRFSQQGQNDSVKPYALIIEGEDSPETDSTKESYGVTTRTMEVAIVLAASLDPASDGRSGSEVMNGLMAESEKAIMIDRQRRDLAIKMTPPAWSAIVADEGQAELVVEGTVRITYRHRDNDPTAAV
jgi:hypothetical protein